MLSACSSAMLPVGRRPMVSQPVVTGGGAGASPSPSPLPVIASITAYANPSNVTCYVTVGGVSSTACLNYRATPYNYTQECIQSNAVALGSAAIALMQQVRAYAANLPAAKFAAINNAWLEYAAGEIAAARFLLLAIGLLGSADALFLLGLAGITVATVWLLARCFPRG